MDAQPKVDDAFIALPGPAAAGTREGSRLWGILAADRARERARSRRNGLCMVLAALGFPVWITAVWPARVPHEWRSFVAAAWAFACGAVLLALAVEWMTHLRRARQVATLGPLPVLRSARRASAASACAPAAEEED